MSKKKLLLHSCCGPCSSGVLEQICDTYDVTIFFYNPNIYPESEYLKRAENQKKYLDAIKDKYNLKCVVATYKPNEFFDNVKGYEAEPEGGKRCSKCFRLRMRKTAIYAKENGYDFFTTTMSVSPHKNAKLLNEIGQEISKEIGIEYLTSDFKKHDGFLKSIQNSKKYNLYRQNYCGCIYSLKDVDNIG